MRRRAVGALLLVLVASGCHRADSTAGTGISLPATPSTTTGPASSDERTSMTAFATNALTVALHRSPDPASYDQDVERAAELMTPAYAKRFRSLAVSTRNDVTLNELSVDAKVIGAGIVAASPVKGRLLLFADQQTSQGDEDPRLTQQSVVVTLVRDGSSWLVSDLETSSTSGEAEPDPVRAAILRSAAAVAMQLVNIDYRTVDTSLRAIKSLSTGDFRDQYDDASGSVATQLVANKSVMTGLVFAAGVVQSTDGSATVLVATTGQVSNTSTQGLLVARSFRMQLHLVDHDGHWLTDQLDFV